MSWIKATDEQLLACHSEGLSAIEAAGRLGITKSAIYHRERSLGIRFARKPNRRPREPDCTKCPDRKLCLLCHRLHVAALPCERDLPYNGHSEAKGDPMVWPLFYERMRHGG